MGKIKVAASFGGKISTGSYQNMSPSFFAEMEFEFKGTHQEALETVDIKQRELQNICMQNFELEVYKAKVLKIQQDRKEFRWYTLPNGKSVPSVTSILNFDVDFFISEDKLNQYAAQGKIIHEQVDHFIKTNEWLDPSELKGIETELFIIKSGSLGLPLHGWDFPKFLEKYPITQLVPGRELVNPIHEYGGTHDFEGVYENVPSVCDVKRTPNKEKNFMQMAAYAKCLGMEHIQRMVIVVINDKTDQGFSKPIVSDDINGYFNMFLARQREFKKVYGI